jgi:hypothetical protein
LEHARRLTGIHGLPTGHSGLYTDTQLGLYPPTITKAFSVTRQFVMSKFPQLVNHVDRACLYLCVPKKVVVRDYLFIGQNRIVVRREVGRDGH